MEWMDKKKVGVPLSQLFSFSFLFVESYKEETFTYFRFHQRKTHPGRRRTSLWPHQKQLTHIHWRDVDLPHPKTCALCMSLFRSSSLSFMGQIETKQYLITVLQRIVRSCQSDRLRFMVLVCWKPKWNGMDWNPTSAQMTHTGQQWLTAALIKTNVKWYSTLCNPHKHTWLREKEMKRMGNQTGFKFVIYDLYRFDAVRVSQTIDSIRCHYGKTLIV